MNADSREYFVENTPVTSDGSAYLLSATTQNFGDHPVGTASAPREMTLTSTGDADLNIESLTVTPPFIVFGHLLRSDHATSGNLYLQCVPSPSRPAIRQGSSRSQAMRSAPRTALSCRGRNRCP